MSEPVGNSPRSMGDIPGNSHKQRRAEEKQALEAREPATKIIEGKVVTKKQPWWKRMGNSIVADDAHSVGDWIMMEVLIPSIKNLIADTVRGSTDMLLFGSSRHRGGGRGSLRTRYDLYSDRDREPTRMMSRESRARHDFDAVILDSRAEAIDVVEALILRVDKYGGASVADLYDLVGVTGSYADRRWGWTDLRTADIRQVRNGYLLDLPRPEPLR